MNNSNTPTENKKNFKHQNLKNISKKILVLSNKGGVGKSTVSTNLAWNFSLDNSKVGLLDADIHGPSVFKMLGIEGTKITHSEEEGPSPVKVKENFWALSAAGFLENSDTPLIWRGPMKMKLLSQFIEDFIWPELDYLFIDCPPGTGDEPLSVFQLFTPIDYVVVVTTPQDIALLDVRKAFNFLKQLGVKKAGIVENMSHFVCPHCQKETNIFKSSGLEKASVDYDVPVLGKLPLETEISNACDIGKPFVESCPNSVSAKNIKMICEKIKQSL